MRTLIILLLTATIAQAQYIEKNEVDEFTGKHVLFTNFVELDQDEYNGTAKIRVARLESRNMLLLSIISHDSWQLLRTDIAYFLVDDKRLEKEIHKIETEVESGLTMEFYGIFIENVNRFRDAENVRFKAGGIVFTFTPEALNAFDVFVDALNGNAKTR